MSKPDRPDILFAYVAALVQPETRRCIDAAERAGYRVYREEIRPDHGQYDYWYAMLRAFKRGRAFLNIEHDMVLSLAQIEALASCDQPLCACAYPMPHFPLEVRQAHAYQQQGRDMLSMGATRFSAAIVRRALPVLRCWSPVTFSHVLQPVFYALTYHAPLQFHRHLPNAVHVKCPYHDVTGDAPLIDPEALRPGLLIGQIQTAKKYLAQAQAQLGVAPSARHWVRIQPPPPPPPSIAAPVRLPQYPPGTETVLTRYLGTSAGVIDELHCVVQPGAEVAIPVADFARWRRLFQLLDAQDIARLPADQLPAVEIITPHVAERDPGPIRQLVQDQTYRGVLRHTLVWDGPPYDGATAQDHRLPDRHHDCGAYAITYGVLHSGADLCLQIADDDWLAPTCVEELVNAWLLQPVDFLVPHIQRAGGRLTGSPVKRHNISTGLFRPELFVTADMLHGPSGQYQQPGADGDMVLDWVKAGHTMGRLEQLLIRQELVA